MKYKFLYIDDTKNQLEEGMINALQSGGDIEILFKGPDDWEDLIAFLIREIPKYNGVILDLRLDDFQYRDGKKASYKGSTVAQELRNLAKEGKLTDFPIVLFSGTDKLEQYLDPTSKDLFDKIVDKTKIEQDDYLNYKDFKNILICLAEGYDCLKKIDRKDFSVVLKESDAHELDSRFIDHYNSLSEKPVHVLAQFLLKEVLGKPSFLIDESFLMTRLGVSEKSPDWNSLKQKLSKHKYTGCFSVNFDFWWMPQILKFWKHEVSRDINLRNISAIRRIELLKEWSGLQGLLPIDKDKRSKSEAFWTVCKARKVAIDTVDGFVISGNDNKFPWQEVQYICVEEALRPTKGFTVSSLEKGRLENLKSILASDEQRIRK